MEPIRRFSSRVIPLLMDNVDTDQIIPARFLKTTSKTGLGESLFHDWRFDSAGKPRPDFILNRTEGRAGSILLTGNNFGCGSSREHAPWALLDFGFRAVISTSFADIFRNNSLKNGLLPVQIDRVVHEKLARRVQEEPDVVLTVDLTSRTLEIPGEESALFSIDAFSRKCLLDGVDELGYLLQHRDAIAAFENLRSR
jgi:3-isopropylmalate/(R)-2-methylmalate dehydratase small subunit